MAAAAVMAHGHPSGADEIDAPESGPVVLFIVDLSGSMNEPFEGDASKLETAKAAFTEAFERVPDDAAVGLRVYGDQFPSLPAAERRRNCEEDTRLLVPIRRGARTEILGAIDAFEASGDTPIGLALERAAGDIPENTAATIVLFSDGRDECYDADLDGEPSVGPSWGPDPCDKARELIERGTEIQGGIDRVETVGFKPDEEAEIQLRCIAEETGGTFTPVRTPEDARDVLPQVLTELGTPREAARLGGTPIEGTPTPQGAPELGRISDPAENQLRYTDTISFGEERWYRAPVYGPSGGNTTVTVFGLPATEGITLSLRGEGGPENDRLPTIERSDEDAGLPRAPSVSLRCPDCGWSGGGTDELSPYWVVSLDGDAPVKGTFDLELLLEGPAWGGVPLGCEEGQRCFYEARISERQRQISDLRAELEQRDDEPEDAEDPTEPASDLVERRDELTDEVARLEGTVQDLGSRRDDLVAQQEEGTDWTFATAMGALALIAAVARLLLWRSSSQRSRGATADTPGDDPSGGERSRG